ncbi:MAG: ribonucleoside triphosphate reductase [Nitrospiraceae bacterium]|nr:ribonucleoside triphosphate reductase [Nitrospiraceae bacterium]
MFEKIRKRDGRMVEFNADKITDAISRAGKATGELNKEIAEKLMLRVVDLAQQVISEIPTVEQIQDVVEDVLITSPYSRTAKAYILYREQHAKIREISDKAGVDIVKQYLKKIDWQVRENSNMTYSLQGLNHYISSEISKIYWLNEIYPPEIREAHLNADFHIHDLDLLAPYCVGWDLLDLLLTGFKGVAGKIESAPAKHFRSALGQVVNFFYTMQGEAAGAQALSNFDTYLAPFIYYDNLDYGEVKQALQEFMFNINVPTRVGFQTPFTNISMDLKIPKFMEEEPVIIGGRLMDKTYGEFQREVEIFNKAFAEVMEEGDAGGRVFTFPIPTYNITKEFDWENPVYEDIWEMVSKYGIPYFSNFINSDLSPEDVRSMCCHLRLDNRELKKRGGGLFGANPLTGSIGVVTINMPKLGYLSEDKDDFFYRLENLMSLAKESLEIKRKVLEGLTGGGLYPYSKFYLRNIKLRFGCYWQNHFSTIGLVGLNEAILNLIGKSIGEAEGKEFGERILDFMRGRLSDFQQETGNIYNLEATPAEGASYRLAMIDKKRYPDIVVANETAFRKHGAEPYYTNSSLLPVNYTDDLFEALDLQDSLQTKYTGGTVFHIYLGESKPSSESIKNLVKKVCHNYSLPYFTITPTFSICPKHGYIFGGHQYCPKCMVEGTKTKCEVYSRVVGYLRPVDQWNAGKQEEFKERELFDKVVMPEKVIPGA